MTVWVRRMISMAVALPGLLAALDASAAEPPPPPGWQHALAIYGMGAAIDGDAAIGPVEVAVDVSMADVLDALEFGAMAAYRADNGTWSFTGDATFMGLGGQDTTEGGTLQGEIDVDQLTLMGTAGRRLTDHLEFLFGLAYLDLSIDLSLRSTGGGPVDLTASRDTDWVDPTVGLQYNRPLGDAWRLNLRGDVGGFGVGSDFMYHLLGTVRWQTSEKIGVFFGYRVIDFDYEDGSGSSFEHYDLTEQGPMVGVSFSF